jgi:putative endonuclease
MDYFVYIIQSEQSGIFYKGYTSYPTLRLEEHNNGQSRYTANKGPWKMIYLEKMPDKTAALKRERQLKRVNSNYINWLINQESNIVSKFDFSQ